MSIYTTTKPTPDNPVAEGYALAQLVRPASHRRDTPTVQAERFIRHGRRDAHEVAAECFRQWGLLRKGLAIRCLAVTVRDLGLEATP